MKKNFVLLALIGFAMFTLCGCGGSSIIEDSFNKIPVKGADGTEYASYQDACRHGDFLAAYNYLDELSQRINELNLDGVYDGWDHDEREKAEQARKKAKKLEEQYEEDKRYIVEQEIMYLFANNNDNSSKRILFLLNENHDQTLISRTVDLAISQRNDEMLKEIARKYNHDLWDKDKVVKRLAEINDEQSNKIVIEITLADNSIPHPSIGLCDYFTGKAYSSDINGHNNECRQILDIAINAGNEDLAKKALSFFVQDIVVQVGASGGETKVIINGVEVDGNHSYVVKYTNESKNEAQKRYQEAVRSGAFKQ